MRPEEVSSTERTWTQYYEPSDYYEVGREEVRQFARAMKDNLPAHWDEAAATAQGHNHLAAPLTFSARLAGNGLNWLLENVLLEYDTSAFVQTDQTLQFHRPLHAGDKIRLIIGLRPIRQKAGGDTVIVEGLLLDAHNELVLELVTTVAGRRGAHAEPQLAAALSDVMMGDFTAPKAVTWQEIPGPPDVPRSQWDVPLDSSVPVFSEVSIGDAIPSRTVILRRGDLVNYSGLSADYNPIHWSDRVTALVGIENVAAQGMLTMGLGASFITDWLGDLSAVLDYRVRFTGIAYVPDDKPAEIEYTGKVKSLNAEDNSATIAMSATAGGKRIFGRATVTVALR